MDGQGGWWVARLVACTRVCVHVMMCACVTVNCVFVVDLQRCCMGAVRLCGGGVNATV